MYIVPVLQLPKWSASQKCTSFGLAGEENMKQRLQIWYGKLTQNRKLYRGFTWGFQAAVAVVFGIVAALLFFQIVVMQEGSMEPTFATGDTFFVNRAVYKFSSPERGDIIVFKTSPEDNAALHIKRVIGLPGETVQIKDGQILIDGTAYEETLDLSEINNPGLADNGVKLESGEYFVLGDNRNNSEDSRYADVGNVKKKYIVGKVWFQVGPTENIGFIKNEK